MPDSYDRPRSSLRFGTGDMYARVGSFRTFVTETSDGCPMDRRKDIVGVTLASIVADTETRAESGCSDSRLTDWSLGRGIESVLLERNDGWSTTFNGEIAARNGQ